MEVAVAVWLPQLVWVTGQLRIQLPTSKIESLFFSTFPLILYHVVEKLGRTFLFPGLLVERRTNSHVQVIYILVPVNCGHHSFAELTKPWAVARDWSVLLTSLLPCIASDDRTL